MLKAPSEQTKDIGLLIARVGLGLSFVLFHGWPKITGGAETWQALGEAVGLPLPVFFGFVATVIEFLGGLLLIVGLLTRPVSLLLFLTMLGAMWSHIIEAERFAWPLEMGIVFLALYFLGAGRYSLDAKLFGQAQPTPA